MRGQNQEKTADVLFCIVLHKISFQLREGFGLEPEDDPSDWLLSPRLEPTFGSIR